MSGLSDKDFDILKHYADKGNRELYWNYLAHVPGNDGYALLALGVVRSDNLPGRVAIGYAQDYAAHQHERGSRFANRTLDEPALEAFGQELIKQDLAQRQAVRGTEFSLNLPAKAVQDAHDIAFSDHKIDPNAWTPRVLLEAARNRGGEAAAEQIWKDMLDNSAMGLVRAGKTLNSIHQNMDFSEGVGYARTLASLEIESAGALPTVNPDVIGRLTGFHYFDPDRRQWYQVDTSMSPLAGPSFPVREETNPRKITELDAAREVRLERQSKSTAFHPDDPYRDIAPSPLTAGIPVESKLPFQVSSLTPMQPGHPDHALYQQIRNGVSAVDATHGRSFDATSERMAANLFATAKSRGLERVDHVLLGDPPRDGSDQRMFAVQGRLDGAHQLVSVAINEAVKTPVEQSFAKLEQHSQAQQQVAQQNHAQEQTPAAMRMG